MKVLEMPVTLKTALIWERANFTDEEWAEIIAKLKDPKNRMEEVLQRSKELGVAEIEEFEIETEEPEEKEE
jgi:hypothetical protein